MAMHTDECRKNPARHEDGSQFNNIVFECPLYLWFLQNHILDDFLSINFWTMFLMSRTWFQKAPPHYMFFIVIFNVYVVVSSKMEPFWGVTGRAQWKRRPGIADVVLFLTSPFSDLSLQYYLQNLSYLSISCREFEGDFNKAELCTWVCILQVVHQAEWRPCLSFKEQLGDLASLACVHFSCTYPSSWIWDAWLAEVSPARGRAVPAHQGKLCHLSWECAETAFDWEEALGHLSPTFKMMRSMCLPSGLSPFYSATMHYFFSKRNMLPIRAKGGRGW